MSPAGGAHSAKGNKWDKRHRGKRKQQGGGASGAIACHRSGSHTALAEALAAHYETVWTPEYLREFVAQKGALPAPSDTRRIADGHLAQVAARAPQAHRVLFLDTDLISTCVYSRYYFGACPAWLERLAHEHRADLYLLTDIDIPWTPDPGQRDGPDVRAELHVFFCEALQTHGVAFGLVSGPLEERMATAVRAVDALLWGV